MAMTDKEIYEGIISFYKGMDNLPEGYAEKEDATDKEKLYALIRHLAAHEDCGMDMLRLIFKRAGVDESRYELLIVDAYGDYY